jgi:hypothetical protein
MKFTDHTIHLFKINNSVGALFPIYFLVQMMGPRASSLLGEICTTELSPHSTAPSILFIYLFMKDGGSVLIS